MSHRDRAHHHTISPAAQDLREVFRWLLQTSDIHKLPLRSDCGFSPRGLVITILLWIFSEENTLTHGFATAREFARTVLRGGVPRVMSYQAFMRLVVRWSDSVAGVAPGSLPTADENRTPGALARRGILPAGG